MNFWINGSIIYQNYLTQMGDFGFLFSEGGIRVELRCVSEVVYLELICYLSFFELEYDPREVMKDF